MIRILICLSIVMTAGCASLYKCGVFYDADTPEAKRVLISRLHELRAALVSDARMEEKLEAGYMLRFVGREGTDFWRLGIAAVELPGSSTHIVIGCPYDERNSERVQKLRTIVEDALGPEALQLIKGQIRYTMLARRGEPNKQPEPMSVLRTAMAHH